ncbi:MULTISPECIES: respiratory nitrate reductase subunit gamma [Microbacterium]|uniref:Respiratory nitrate reductase subunit gamma n=1 Tax=Microbacterium wangchenii TaxID=2541726 RepID=A0ABX5SUC0_9MICO|nr:MULTISPECIES: respiratory nitrate reductase subunit gamma [Microbacterium]MCK6065401.1 respiratory nitrate reductase subunit gamma [Microbacterium sp. EYE_512]QBR88840.1 respiratory nitrate reductase subunit gamma [Microbacterium wangchenii]TXK20565.1 respiratory nitrate reductase subunit gamma [Microbacterium wangchenii]
MDVFLWGVLPYVTIVLLVGGLVWRYRYDQFGWTTRSSQLYESRLLRIGSPLFHFGILIVLIGHIMGLVIPESWTDAIGVTEDTYHAVALILGTFAGFATLVGVVILIYRRRTTGPVFMATTKNDKTMYVVLVAAIITGLATTVISAVDPSPDQNYRDSVAPWFRSIFILQPDIAAMNAAPLAFHIHTLAGMALFILWPFTRLVHAFTAPVQYLFRPYIVYRSRDRRPTTAGATRRGWAPVGTPDRAPERVRRGRR